MTIATQAESDHYCSDILVVTPEDFHVEGWHVDTVDTLHSILSCSIGITDVVSNQLNDSEEDSSITDSLWQVRKNMEIVQDVIQEWFNGCNTCARCERKSWEGIYEKIKNNSPGSVPFSMAVQFVMGLDGNVGEAARALFAVVKDGQELQKGLLGIIEVNLG